MTDARSTLSDLIRETDRQTEEILVGLNNFLFPTPGMCPLQYRDVLALAIACAPSAEWVLWDTIKYRLGYYPQQYTMLDDIVAGAFQYYTTRLTSQLVFAKPTPSEEACLRDLMQRLQVIDDTLEDITRVVYECGKDHYWPSDLREKIDSIPPLETNGMDENQVKLAKKAHKDMYGSVAADGQALLREYFAMIYYVLLGQPDGPRTPDLIHMLGIAKFIDRVSARLVE